MISPTTDSATIRDAVKFLRRAHRPIEPRKLWPAGITSGSTRIPESERFEVGLALSIWGDAGWGAAVREEKYRRQHFSDEIAEAVAHMIQQWNSVPNPQWVTAVPSLRHPELVPSLAQRVAKLLDLPFVPALAKNP